MLGATSVADAAIVLTVKVDFVVPGFRELGLRAQVGGTAVAGVTVQAKSTVAASPAPAVMVIVAVAEPPADTLELESVPVLARLKSWPVPDKAMVCGLPDALSVTMSVAVSTPAADGVIVMLIVQDPGPGTEAQLLLSAKSALLVPVMAMAVVRFTPLPPLDNMTGTDVLLVLIA